MARGREELEWERASHLMAIVFNGNAAIASAFDGVRRSILEPREFNPFMQDGTKSNAERDDGHDEAREIVERETAKTHGEQQGEH